MTGFILGKKSQQSQTFTEKGERIPVTFIKTAPCYLIDVKNPAKGYFAVKLGWGLSKNIKKSVEGEIQKAGIKTPLRFLKEIRLEGYGKMLRYVEENGKKGIVTGEQKLFVGDEIKPEDVFKKGEKLTISGFSKGKGFQGVVRRHAFAGGPRTHGQSDRERAPGSIGQTTTPGRVYKGKRMAGHMGFVRVTVKNLEVVAVAADGITVKGLVPGWKQGFLEIRSAN
ncbi:50S ribosomal protein L3 [Candidatus Roizmanbacteria bacterium]|nr:50S ribosomal protein L3 [Candidatus Roizmanbacteria bacterium]